MATTLFQCPNCHAPLPPGTGGFVVCQYCRATVSIESRSTARAPEPPVQSMPGPGFEERVKAATATFKRVLDSKGTPEQAAWYAAHDFGAPHVDPGEVAYGAIALARDFDAKNSTAALRDPTSMVRLLEAYAKLAVAVRASGTGSVNLPFLTATKNGPLHYQRDFDARSLAMLVASVRG